MRLSKDKTFLVAYVNIDEKETFFIYNTLTRARLWTAKLDLAGGEMREDPEKLLCISDDCLNLFARGENNKGIIMYSLFDGSVV